LGEVNGSPVNEAEETEQVAEPGPGMLREEIPAAVAWRPSWLRLAYALEFFIALIAIISLWSEIGGEGHLDLMPWHVKLACILGLAWCSVRFTAGIVEQKEVWTLRTITWFAGILLFCVAMGGITYYYHLHETPEDGDEDTTAAVSIRGPSALVPGTFVREIVANDAGQATQP
jgi:hypothetical protein